MPGVWYRKARDMWFTSIGGKQVPLNVRGEDAEHLAKQALNDLAKATPPPAPPRAKTVKQAVADYLAGVAGEVKPWTLRGYRGYLNRFVAHFGTYLINEVTEKEVEDRARKEKWASSTRHNYLATVETCLKWNRVMLRFKKPPKESAGAESVIDPATYQKLLFLTRGDTQVLIRFLWATGCRPGEATALTCEAVDWTNRCVRLKEHKTRHRGKARTIHLSSEAAALLAHQRDKYGGTGLLFRGKNGTQLGRMAIVKKFYRLSRQVGRRVTAYGFRHTYATRALADGESDTVVAALLGHANTAMIHLHYSHVSQMGRALADAANRIGGKAG